MPKPSIDKLVPDAEALRLVMELMAIPGRSGEESAVVDYLRKQLASVGIAANQLRTDDAHRRSPIGGQLGNIVLKLPGTVRGPRRLLAAHTDTVPVCLGSRPVRKGGLVVSADKQTGLGADDRSGTAILLSTVLALRRGKLPHPPLTFLWTVQEEVGLYGARHLRKSLLGNPKLAFNFDGSAANVLKVGATGGYRMAIEVHGLASHAGMRPQEGVSAIAIASLAIVDLVKNGWHGRIEKGGRTGTSNVGVIAGGEATNVVTNYVRLRAEARSHDAKFRARIVKEIEAAFRRAARAVRNDAGQHGRVEVEGHLDYESFRLTAKEPCVAAAIAALEAEGLEPELSVANGGLDANWLTAHGFPAVTLGCGQRNLHTTQEQLVIADFHAARRVALRLATAGESR